MGRQLIMTKRILTKACIYYSIITIILLALLLIIGDDSDIMVITPFRFMLIYLHFNLQPAHSLDKVIFLGSREV